MQIHKIVCNFAASKQKNNIKRPAQVGKLCKEKMATMYFITMDEGGKQSYVATKDDVEAGGFVDATPEDFGFSSREEAESTMAELQAYADEKGYDLSFFIEEA